MNNQNTVVRDIVSVNSKFFHIVLLQNNNMKMINLRINAPENSPNTDGTHIELSSGVIIADTHISTCERLHLHRPGEVGNDNIDIARVHCGPGNGMSVGSLGRYVDEGDITHIHVKDMTFEGTMNGVRIKTWENSPTNTKSLAVHMLFDNMVMKDVQNPIIIDQKYCPYYNCEHKYVSGVTIRHQGHFIQEHQGHLVPAGGRATPMRRSVPGHGAVGHRPEVQGTGRHLKVQERQGQVHRPPVPKAMRLARSGGCTGADGSLT
ncbi:exopolygalacturonase-like [Lolium rigidum]|uniref:exopolygalacturonase-like n=1 Tax=Lolium rigidum TaxID=89674 RepID=UPI001F5E22E7|nr:exopolygalacturonase-like [Lolium rigidum]XP_047090145.1 exopolygalacturonase-like [Lolium rigidum]XP_047090146.1 exopolygalacturonase-like [Lolium rigidum]XP_047090147.1 exopolygalacturonase-like [Lolium rigidum]XP_047090148.1 exopolygalacturonase-like [Lolium rigidum]